MREKKDYGFVHDLKRDWTTLRSLRGRKLLRQIWDYYKVPILITLFALFSLYTIGNILWQGQRPCRLRVCVVLNTDDYCKSWFDNFETEWLGDGQGDAMDVNLDQPFDYENMYYSVMEMEVMTTIASKRMDVAVCGEDMYSYLLAINACLPLDEALPEAFRQRVEDRLDYRTANLQYDGTGHVDESAGVDGFFALNLEGTAFETRYNRPDRFGEDPGALYAVIISNSEHINDSITLLEALAQTQRS